MIKDASPRLDAHTTEIVKWLNEHKYHVASPVDIEFREPNARHPYERAIVKLRSSNHAIVWRTDSGLDCNVLWLLGKKK